MTRLRTRNCLPTSNLDRDSLINERVKHTTTVQIELGILGGKITVSNSLKADRISRLHLNWLELAEQFEPVYHCAAMQVDLVRLSMRLFPSRMADTEHGHHIQLLEERESQGWDSAVSWYDVAASRTGHWHKKCETEPNGWGEDRTSKLFNPNTAVVHEALWTNVGRLLESKVGYFMACDFNSHSLPFSALEGRWYGKLYCRGPAVYSNDKNEIITEALSGRMQQLSAQSLEAMGSGPGSSADICNAANNVTLSELWISRLYERFCVSPSIENTLATLGPTLPQWAVYFMSRYGAEGPSELCVPEGQCLRTVARVRYRTMFLPHDVCTASAIALERFSQVADLDITFSPSELANSLDIHATTLARYAQKAGVIAPATIKRNHQYDVDSVFRICKWIESSVISDSTKANARALLDDLHQE